MCSKQLQLMLRSSFEPLANRQPLLDVRRSHLAIASRSKKPAHIHIGNAKNAVVDVISSLHLPLVEDPKETSPQRHVSVPDKVFFAAMNILEEERMRMNKDKTNLLDRMKSQDLSEADKLLLRNVNLDLGHTCLAVQARHYLQPDGKVEDSLDHGNIVEANSDGGSEKSEQSGNDTIHLKQVSDHNVINNDKARNTINDLKLMYSTQYCSDSDVLHTTMADLEWRRYKSWVVPRLHRAAKEFNLFGDVFPPSLADTNTADVSDGSVSIDVDELDIYTDDTAEIHQSIKTWNSVYVKVNFENTHWEGCYGHPAPPNWVQFIVFFERCRLLDSLKI
jgi:hypothetical protein